MMTRPIEVILSAPFTRRIRKLLKRYPNIRQDVEPLIEQLKQGETPGNQIQGVGYTVYKVRVLNSDAQRGKSGGYRLIYYIYFPTRIILVTIYTKSERSDISAQEIKAIIDNLSSR